MKLNETNQTPITISDSARNHIENFLKSDTSAIGFRFGVKKSGCSGFAYVADIAKEAKEDEQHFSINGIHVLMNQQSIEVLHGTEINFIDKGMGQKELVFNNPNMEHSCGCGESFTVKSAPVTHNSKEDD